MGLLLAAVLLTGCEADLQDGIGPRVPVPNATGGVVREAAPAGGLEVELRRAADAVVINSTETASNGRFDFSDVGAGAWEVKISGDENGDFEAVTREFTLADPDSLVDLGVFDIAAYGAAPLAPEDGAVMARPGPFAPVLFTWSLPTRSVLWARAQVYDAAGQAVWVSDKEAVAQALWNGLGSEGEYAGRLVPAGDYTWRVKVGFADGTEARLDRRGVRFE